MGKKDEVSLRGITKRFPGVLANDCVDLIVKRGEAHALLGENGAGKTTLMNILSGLYQPDAGEIQAWGERVSFRSPRDAIARGIGMVHQHFQLVERLTVTQNFVLGLRGRRLFRPAWAAREVEAATRRYGLAVAPEAYVWQLSMGERQRLEILRLLHRGAELLILDEPTSVLSPMEARSLYATLTRLKDDGKAVIFITHRLPEVMDVADRVTVMRRGGVVGSFSQGEVSMSELASLMVGTAPLQELIRLDNSLAIGPPVLELVDISALNDRGLETLTGVSLQVNAGEIVGVAGVTGNGQHELVEVTAGLRKPVAGRVRIRGVDVTGRGPLVAVQNGLGHVPEDRLGMGLIPSMSVLHNMMFWTYRKPPIARGWRVDWPAGRQWAASLIDQFQVRSTGLNMPARTLSGGNQQRLVLARELSNRPLVLLAVQPTRGLDIAATAAVRRLLLELKAQNTGIFLVSEDLDEILSLSDRVAVLYRGRVVAVLQGPGFSREEVGLLMTAGASSRELLHNNTVPAADM